MIAVLEKTLNRVRGTLQKAVTVATGAIAGQLCSDAQCASQLCLSES